jgi:maltose alpha-D-glucosyltransferase/alpha-amylase
VGTPACVDAGMAPSVFVHRYDAPEGSILLLHNLSDVAATVDLSSVNGANHPWEVFANTTYDPLDPSLAGLKLGPYGYRWIRLRRGM